MRCGPRYKKKYRNIKCSSGTGEWLWLLLVTFTSGIWQQAHGRAQLFDEYFESEGPKDSAGHMLPFVFALWNDNVASLKQHAEATELPFLASRSIEGQTWKNWLHVCMGVGVYMSVFDVCCFTLCLWLFNTWCLWQLSEEEKFVFKFLELFCLQYLKVFYQLMLYRNFETQWCNNLNCVKKYRQVQL